MNNLALVSLARAKVLVNVNERLPRACLLPLWRHARNGAVLRGKSTVSAAQDVDQEVSMPIVPKDIRSSSPKISKKMGKARKKPRTNAPPKPKKVKQHSSQSLQRLETRMKDLSHGESIVLNLANNRANAAQYGMVGHSPTGDIWRMPSEFFNPAELHGVSVSAVFERASLLESVGVPAIDALGIAVSLPFLNNIELPPTAAEIVAILKKYNINIGNAMSYGILAMEPAVVTRRLEDLEIGFKNKDVGVVVSKNPSLLLMPINTEVWERFGNLQTPLKPGTNSYRKLLKDASENSQVRGFEQKDDDAIKSAAEFLGSFSSQEFDLSGALEQLKKMDFDELEDKLCFLQQEPLSFSHRHITTLLSTHAHILVSINVEECKQILTCLRTVVPDDASLRSMVLTFPSILTRKAFCEDLQYLRECGLTEETLQLISSTLPTTIMSSNLTKNSFHYRMEQLTRMYSRKIVTREINYDKCFLGRMNMNIFVIRLALIERVGKPIRDVAKVLRLAETDFLNVVGVQEEAYTEFAKTYRKLALVGGYKLRLGKSKAKSLLPLPVDVVMSIPLKSKEA
eukprot:m.157446 g.157446  ORF g.157446 m.157446 type:complete len:569 (+) comp15118_c0_seq3:271-1977(+)